MTTSGIYAITNTVSGKVYVGQAQNVEKRWNDHASYLSRGAHINRHLQAAWNKYGADSFEFSVIELCDVDDLDEREMHHIAIWKSQDLCYNQTDGGGGCRGRVHTDEAKAKLSAAAKGNQHSLGHTPTDEARAKISAALKGNQNLLGYTHTDETKSKLSAAWQNRAPASDETRAKLSEAQAGRVFSDEHRAKISAAAKARWAAKKAANDNRDS